MTKAKATPEPQPGPDETPPPETAGAATEPPRPQLSQGTTVEAVESRGGLWHLVTHGCWEISVGPDGLLMLPRHLVPREVQDFIACATDAATLGAWVIECNLERAKGDDRSLPPARATVTAGGVPPGLARMVVAGGPNQPRPSSAIGRPRGRGRAVAPPGARV